MFVQRIEMPFYSLLMAPEISIACSIWFWKPSDRLCSVWKKRTKIEKQNKTVTSGNCTHCQTTCWITMTSPTEVTDLRLTTFEGELCFNCTPTPVPADSRDVVSPRSSGWKLFCCCTLSSTKELRIIWENILKINLQQSDSLWKYTLSPGYVHSAAVCFPTWPFSLSHNSLQRLCLSLKEKKANIIFAVTQQNPFTVSAAVTDLSSLKAARPREINVRLMGSKVKSVLFLSCWALK